MSLFGIRGFQRCALPCAVSIHVLAIVLSDPLGLVTNRAAADTFFGPGGPAAGHIATTGPVFDVREDYLDFGALDASVSTTVVVSVPVGYNSQGGYLIEDRSYLSDAWVGAGAQPASPNAPLAGAVAATARSETYTGPGNWGSRPAGFATSVVNWFDSVRLVWNGSGPAPAMPTALEAHVGILGKTDVTESGYFNGGFNYGYQSAMVDYGFNTHFFIDAGSGGSVGVVPMNNHVTMNVGEWLQNGVDNASIHLIGGVFTGIIEGDFRSGAAFSFGGSVRASASYGSSAADISVRLTSLTVPGGPGGSALQSIGSESVTPEQLGWKVVFGSGMVLPSSVPEIDPNGVSGVLALVTGALGLLERRRVKATAA